MSFTCHYFSWLLRWWERLRRSFRILKSVCKDWNKTAAYVQRKWVRIWIWQVVERLSALPHQRGGLDRCFNRPLLSKNRYVPVPGPIRSAPVMMESAPNRLYSQVSPPVLLRVPVHHLQGNPQAAMTWSCVMPMMISLLSMAVRMASGVLGSVNTTCLILCSRVIPQPLSRRIAAISVINSVLFIEEVIRWVAELSVGILYIIFCSNSSVSCQIFWGLMHFMMEAWKCYRWQVSVAAAL